MCSGCPWNPERTGPVIDAETWSAVRQRIADGERWVCHMSTNGPQLTERSQHCAGAPSVTSA